MKHTSFLILAALATLQASAVYLDYDEEDSMCFAETQEEPVAQRWIDEREKRRWKFGLRQRGQAKRQNKLREKQLKNPLEGDLDPENGVFPPQYFNYPEFQDKSAADKMKDLMAAVQADQTTQENLWVEWGDLGKEDMKHSFDEGDEMPEGVLKTVHTQGVMARVKWEPINGAAGYEGLVAESNNDVLIRFSETSMLHEESKGLMPSLALKFVRDGTWSDNLMGMPSFANSGSWNFFENPMETAVPRFRKKTCEFETIRKILGSNSGTRSVFSTGISEMTLHNKDGTDTMDKYDYDNRKFPYRLRFDAIEPFKTMFSSDKELDDDGNQVSWLDQLARIEEGAELMKVTGQTAPEGHPDSKWVDIATIKLETPLRRSKFGDGRLFFSHLRKEDDQAAYPLDWMELDRGIDGPKCYVVPKNHWHWGVPDQDSEFAWPQDKEEAKEMFMEQQRGGCPFQWIWDYTKSIGMPS